MIQGGLGQNLRDSFFAVCLSSYWFGPESHNDCFDDERMNCRIHP
jgi:hypothetical protein